MASLINSPVDGSRQKDCNLYNYEAQSWIVEKHKDQYPNKQVRWVACVRSLPSPCRCGWHFAEGGQQAASRLFACFPEPEQSTMLCAAGQSEDRQGARRPAAVVPGARPPTRGTRNGPEGWFSGSGLTLDSNKHKLKMDLWVPRQLRPPESRAGPLHDAV